MPEVLKLLYHCSFFLVDDRPLIVQFAAHNAKDFADATEMIKP